MLKEKLTLVINSCDKFSDLWENHIDEDGEPPL